MLSTKQSGDTLCTASLPTAFQSTALQPTGSKHALVASTTSLIGLGVHRLLLPSYTTQSGSQNTVFAHCIHLLSGSAADLSANFP